MFNFTKKNNIACDSGQIVITATLFSLFLSVAIVSAISSPVVSQLKINRDLSKSKQSFFTSESSNEDVVYRLKNGMEISDQETLQLNDGEATTVISDIGNGLKEIISTGDVKNRFRKTKSRVRVTTGTSFSYGLFTGQGGVELDNNSRINGSIYSNGSIIGGSNVVIAGDVYVANQVATTTDTEWTNQNDDFIFGRFVDSQERIDAVQSFSPSSPSGYLSKAGLYLRKVGSPANLSIKITEDKNGEPDKNSIIASGTIFSGLAGENYSFIDVSFDNNPEISSSDTYWIVADLVEDSNNYYVWGFDNTDGYTNGTGRYSSDWEKSTFANINGDLNFKIWVSDSENEGLLDSVIVDDGLGGIFSAHAHTITNTNVSGDVFAYSFSNGTAGGDINADNISDCTISGDANYNSSSNCAVGGTETSPTVPPTDPTYITTPISQANIDSWKEDATSGGIISSGDYSPEDNQSIGAGVIEGSLIIGSGKTIFLEGTVYVKDNIEMSNNSEIKLGSSYGESGSGTIISDGWIYMAQGVLLNSPRTTDGHIMLLSLADCDGIVFEPQCTYEGASISASNNTQADILTAPFGLIRMKQNVSAVSLVGERLKLDENLILNYEQGLSNVDFSSGPGGTWELSSWREIE
ncbi:hypothetical protein ACFL05_00915 [Patescibacteria group bacterium]